MDVPETRYAKTTDGVHIAYQVVGDALVDLVFVMGWTSNIEAMWEEPALARFLSRLASFSRLILFDKRGTGLSDRVPDDKLPSLETRMDDVRAVMDAVGSERAVVFGVSEGGPMTIVFAATYPARTTALILFGTAARFAWAPDFPWGVTSGKHARALDEIDRSWGTREHAARELRDWAAPSLAGDERMVSWLDSYLRRAASPGAAAALERMNHEIDVRQVLSAVRVPSLVVARIGDRDFDIAATREMSGAIPGARLIELPGDDHFFWVGDAESVLDAVQSFVESIRAEETEFDRVLASVLFTDLVGSTEKAAELGDRGWRDLVERHHATVRAMLARYRGTEVDTAGDGFFATFDGPARAVRCAQAIVEAVRPLGMDVRAGVHTGEVETIDTKAGGIAVVIASRIASMAIASDVLVSSTVKDLTAGSGLVFEDAGEHKLKGVPDRWRLYRVTGP